MHDVLGLLPGGQIALITPDHNKPPHQLCAEAFTIVADCIDDKVVEEFRMAVFPGSGAAISASNMIRLNMLRVDACYSPSDIPMIHC